MNLRRVLDELHDQCGWSSNPALFHQMRAFHTIRSLGRVALPELARDLREHPTFEVIELMKSITGHTPEIPDEHRGRLKEIAKAWLQSDLLYQDEQRELPLG